ncbi:hypothetical protein V2G26_013787 [Clonostachys chloroleuca]
MVMCSWTEQLRLRPPAVTTYYKTHLTLTRQAPIDQSEFGLGCRKDDSLSMYLLSRCQQLPSGIGFFGTWPLPSFRMIQLPVAVDSAIKAVLSID